MENPFVYGEVVPAAAFVDRVGELKRLSGDLASGQKVFLISPRRYGKSSLISRALASLERDGVLAVQVTVSSYSSYVAFLEGYARAVLSATTRWERAASWIREALGAVAARGAARDRRVGRRRVRGVVPGGPHGARRLAPRRGGVPAARAPRGRAPAPGGRLARRVPGGGRVQRRQRRRGAARGRAAPAAGRLRLRRLGADADGADDRAEAAVLQGRAGDAPREDPAGHLRALHRLALHPLRVSASSRGSRRRCWRSRASCRTTCSGSRTRCGTMRARRAGGRWGSTTCT